MLMDFKYDVIKGQKFDIGRTINPFKCDCQECDFLHCPKKNYAPKTKLHKYTVYEYINFHADELKKGLFAKIDTADDLTEDFVRLFTFPKGTYWRFDSFDKAFYLVTFSRSGKEINKGAVSILSGKIWDYDFSAAQEKLAARMSKAIKMINDFKEEKQCPMN